MIALYLIYIYIYIYIYVVVNVYTVYVWQYIYIYVYIFIYIHTYIYIYKWSYIYTLRSKGGEYKRAGDGPKRGTIGVQGEGVQGETAQNRVDTLALSTPPPLDTHAAFHKISSRSETLYPASPLGKQI